MIKKPLAALPALAESTVNAATSCPVAKYAVTRATDFARLNFVGQNGPPLRNIRESAVQAASAAAACQCAACRA
jgi:hypothetical protein